MTKIIQISDMHLMACANQLYRDFDVEGRFRLVLNHLLIHHQDAEIILLTGDLVHQGGIESYRRILDMMAVLDRSWYWIPGNHDCRADMESLQGPLVSDIQLEGWKITLLDSTSNPDGYGSGALADSELDYLSRQLSTGGNQLVVVHHNPISVNSRWQQAISLANAETFNQVLINSPATGAVIFGHLHQYWDVLEGNWRMLGCPSSAVQFQKNCEHLELLLSGTESWPGYRWIELSADGKLDTGIERCDPDQLTD